MMLFPEILFVLGALTSSTKLESKMTKRQVLRTWDTVLSKKSSRLNDIEMFM